MDTTPPEFTGSITVSLFADYLVASWPSNAVLDSEELFDMNYEFAVGMFAFRERPFNLKGGVGGYIFFLKKYSDSHCC